MKSSNFSGKYLTTLILNLSEKTKKVLIETVSKKSDDFLMGRTDCNKSVIIPKRQTFVDQNGNLDIPKEYSPGDEVSVKINKANSATLFGEPVLIR